MKKLLLTIALGVACVSALAQGQLNFANYPVPGSSAIIHDAAAGNVLAGGSAYAADLFWGPAGTTDSTLLTSLGLHQNFAAGAGAGYFIGGAATIPGAPGGTTIVVQVRAWDTASGASWAAAAASAAGHIGASTLFNVTLSTLPATPPNLVGLTSFNLVAVPEPSTMALAGLGAAALLIFRRRK